MVITCPHCKNNTNLTINFIPKDWEELCCMHCSKTFKIGDRADNPKRHGSPTFYALLTEMGDLHDKKSHDYASNDNPYGNYHFAGLVSSMFAHCAEDAGFAGRVAEKLYRLANLEKAGKTPKNEGIEDTERDICVIICLWMADRRDRRAKLSKDIDNKDSEFYKNIKIRDDN